MRRQLFAAACVCCVLASLTVAQETQTEPKPVPAADRETIVYAVRNGPVKELMSTLMQVFDKSHVRVAAERTNNLLILQVSSDSRQEVLRLLDELDKPLPSIVIQIHLLKTHGDHAEDLESTHLSGPTGEVLKHIKDLEELGQITLAQHMELTVVDNQKSMLQVGERVPVVTGSSQSREGSRINNYQWEDVGTIMSVQAKSSIQGGITMDLNFEKSEVVPSQQVDEFVPASVSTLTQQSTVQLRDGHSVLMGKMVSRSRDESGAAYLVVSGRIVDPGNSVADRSFSQRTSAAPRPAFPEARSRQATRSPRRGTNLDSRYVRYSRAVIARYDENQDGALSSEEWESMSKSPREADSNNDGSITESELADWYRQRGSRWAPGD